MARARSSQANTSPVAWGGAAIFGVRMPIFPCSHQDGRGRSVVKKNGTGNLGEHAIHAKQRIKRINTSHSVPSNLCSRVGWICIPPFFMVVFIFFASECEEEQINMEPSPGTFIILLSCGSGLHFPQSTICRFGHSIFFPRQAPKQQRPLPQTPAASDPQCQQHQVQKACRRRTQLAGGGIFSFIFFANLTFLLFVQHIGSLLRP